MQRAAYNAHRIGLARKRAGLTQAQLGDLVGLSASAIGMYEQGRRIPDAEMLARLCDKLSASPAWVLGKGEDADLYQYLITEVVDAIVARLRQ